MSEPSNFYYSLRREEIKLIQTNLIPTNEKPSGYKNNLLLKTIYKTLPLPIELSDKIYLKTIKYPPSNQILNIQKKLNLKLNPMEEIFNIYIYESKYFLFLYIPETKERKFVWDSKEEEDFITKYY